MVFEIPARDGKGPGEVTQGDREGAARGVTRLNSELVFVGEAAGERRRRPEGSGGRSGEHAGGGKCKCQSSHGSLLSGKPALAGRSPESDVK